MGLIEIIVDVAAAIAVAICSYVIYLQKKLIKNYRDINETLHAKFEATKNFSEKLLSENKSLKERSEVKKNSKKATTK